MGCAVLFDLFSKGLVHVVVLFWQQDFQWEFGFRGRVHH